MQHPANKKARDQLIEQDFKIILHYARQQQAAEISERIARIEHLAHYLPDIITLLETAPQIIGHPGASIFAADYKRAYREVTKKALDKSYKIKRRRGKPSKHDRIQSETALSLSTLKKVV